jgi:hypothetical protein
MNKNIQNIIKLYLLPNKEIVKALHKNNLKTLERCTQYIKLDLHYCIIFYKYKYLRFNGPLDYFDHDEYLWKQNMDKYWSLTIKR